MTTAKKPHHTTVAAEPLELSDADQKLLLSYPVHTAAEIQSYLKPAEGIDRVGPLVVKFLKAHPAIATTLTLDPAALSTDLAEATRLDAPTQAAYALYRRGYENAMEKRSDVTRAIFKVNRVVQNTSDEALIREIAAISEWVSATHAHGAATAPATPAAPDPAKTP